MEERVGTVPRAEWIDENARRMWYPPVVERSLYADGTAECMVSLVTLAGSFVLMVILLVSVAFAVERRERFVFVIGVFLVMGALTLLPTAIWQGIAAVVGVLLVLVSTVPLLRKQAAEV